MSKIFSNPDPICKCGRQLAEESGPMTASDVSFITGFLFCKACGTRYEAVYTLDILDEDSIDDQTRQILEA